MVGKYISLENGYPGKSVKMKGKHTVVTNTLVVYRQ
jgi:hypothetical protein